jgi:polyisoprenoid-binding protein YceI
MKRTLLTLTLGTALFFPQTSNAADVYTLDPTHTTVVWSANHLGFSNPFGLFSMVEGTLTLDEAAPENSSVDATISIANLFTGNSKFDDHLKNKDFFNAPEFPKATFKSTKVEKTGDKTAKVTGDLTMLGVTKPVVLDVTYNKSGVFPMNQKPTVGFSATTTIKRSEWGMGYGIEHGVSDDVKLMIEAEANKDAPKASN